MLRKQPRTIIIVSILTMFFVSQSQWSFGVAFSFIAIFVPRVNCTTVLTWLSSVEENSKLQFIRIEKF